MMVRTITTFASVAALWLALADSPRAADAPASPEGWGTVKGQVTFGGEAAPARKVIAVTADVAHCTSKGPLSDEEWVVNAKNKGVRYAFVWLAPVSGTKMPIHPRLNGAKLPDLVIDQPCCQFVPHALAIREGQVLVTKNSSPVPHNTNYAGSPLKNPGANPLLPPKSSLEIKDLKADNFPVKFSCNIHPWMNAWVRVFDHPYFAVTDADGKFEFKDAPAGKYRLVGWHEAVGWLDGGKKGQEITIKADGTVEIPLIAKP